jgi:hypothetical protein
VGEMRTGVRRVRFQPILAPERGPPFGLSSGSDRRPSFLSGGEPGHGRRATEPKGVLG